MKTKQNNHYADVVRKLTRAFLNHTGVRFSPDEAYAAVMLLTESGWNDEMQKLIERAKSNVKSKS